MIPGLQAQQRQDPLPISTSEAFSSSPTSLWQQGVGSNCFCQRPSAHLTWSVEAPGANNSSSAEGIDVVLRKVSSAPLCCWAQSSGRAGSREQVPCLARHSISQGSLLPRESPHTGLSLKLLFPAGSCAHRQSSARRTGLQCSSLLLAARSGFICLVPR